MYDASGRYSGQFFFGNDYWLGSSSLCNELTNEETNTEVPPLPITFLVAKVRININGKLTPVVRISPNFRPGKTDFRFLRKCSTNIIYLKWY